MTQIVRIATSLALVTGLALAAAAPSLTYKPTLTAADAQRVLAGAVERAMTGAGSGAIAVVDDGGALLMFTRLDGTFPAGADVSIGKARTAATFRKPTKAFEDAVRSGRTPLLSAPGLTPLQGGIPIVINGHVVGGVGVSGAASAEEDEQIALAGAAALSDQGGQTSGRSSSTESLSPAQPSVSR